MNDLTKHYFATGFYSRQAAAIIGPEIERLAAAKGGDLEAEELVTAAAPEGSPVHAYFTWDNAEAGHLWRVQEARTMLTHVRVEYVRADGEVMGRQRIVVSVPTPAEEGEEEAASTHRPRKYVLVQELQRRPDEQERARQDAIAYVRAANKRLEEFEEMFGALPSYRKVREGMRELVEQSGIA